MRELEDEVGLLDMATEDRRVLVNKAERRVEQWESTD